MIYCKYIIVIVNRKKTTEYSRMFPFGIRIISLSECKYIGEKKPATFVYREKTFQGIFTILYGYDGMSDK